MKKIPIEKEATEKPAKLNVKPEVLPSKIVTPNVKRIVDKSQERKNLQKEKQTISEKKISVQQGKQVESIPSKDLKTSTSKNRK